MRRLGDALVAIGEVVILAGRTLATATRRPLELRASLRELYLMGNRALGLGVFMAAFAGLVLAFQFGEGLARFGARQYIGQLTALALFRELIPVLVALVIGGRLAAGIAAEIGAMTATEQVDAIRVLGGDPLKKLALPRVAAAMVILPLFTIVGDVVGTGAGMIVARFEFGVPMRWYLVAVLDFLLVQDFLSGVAKAAVFGLASAAIACRAGFQAYGGTEGVGRATTSAVVQSSLAVIVLDYFLTRLIFNTGNVVR